MQQKGHREGRFTPWHTIHSKKQQNPTGVFNRYNLLMTCTAVPFSLPPHPAREKRPEQSCGSLFVTACHLDLPANTFVCLSCNRNLIVSIEI